MFCGVVAVFVDSLRGSEEDDDENVLPILMELEWMNNRLCFGENRVDF